MDAANARRAVRSRRRWDPKRITGLLSGLGLAACSVGLIGAGAFAAWAGAGGKYLDLGAHGNYRTDRYGLATESTDWRTTLFSWAGSVRLKIESQGRKAVFVGAAAPDAIGGYLSGVSYTTIAENTRRTDHDGTAPATPAREVEWTARAEGAGTQTLSWKATRGRQVVFAMNADGSRTVHVRVVSSAVTLARMPWWVPAGSLVLGIILLPTGVVVIRRTIHARGPAARS